MNYGKTFFGQHLIIKLRYKLTTKSLNAIHFAFPDLVIIDSLPLSVNPKVAFYKFEGCLKANQYQDFEQVMRIARYETVIAESEFTIEEARKALKAETAPVAPEEANLDTFDFNLLT
jgi:hypothetical protein